MLLQVDGWDAFQSTILGFKQHFPGLQHVRPRIGGYPVTLLPNCCEAAEGFGFGSQGISQTEILGAPTAPNDYRLLAAALTSGCIWLLPLPWDQWWMRSSTTWGEHPDGNLGQVLLTRGQSILWILVLLHEVVQNKMFARWTSHWLVCIYIFLIGYRYCLKWDDAFRSSAELPGRNVVLIPVISDWLAKTALASFPTAYIFQAVGKKQPPCWLVVKHPIKNHSLLYLSV